MSARLISPSCRWLSDFHRIEEELVHVAFSPPLAGTLDRRRCRGDPVVAGPHSGQPALFMVLWLVGWAFGELFVPYAWLWNAFGKEVVTVRVGTLVLKRDILGFGRSRVFPVSEISHLRASGLFGSFLLGWAGGLNYWGLSGGVIVFESGGKTHRFGIHLEEDEARQVVAELVRYLPTFPPLRGANSNER